MAAKTSRRGYRNPIDMTEAPFYCKADWNGSSGTNNEPKIRRALSHLKDYGGGKLILPEGDEGYLIDGLLELDDCHGVTLEMHTRHYNMDLASPSKARLVFRNASHGVRITRGFGISLINVQIDASDVCTSPIIVDQMSQSLWTNTSVYRAPATAILLTDTSGVAGAGVLWSTFINTTFERCGVGFELNGVLNTSGVFHCTFMNTRADYAGDAAINLVSCDNDHFIDTYTFRRSGSGVGMKWVKTGAYYPNSIYVNHLQGTVDIPLGAIYPGRLDDYDMANGQPYPTLPAGTIMPISTSGLNSVGFLIPEESIVNPLSRINGSAGKITTDPNNYGVMRYNGLNGNGVIEKLDPTTRGQHRLINPDGTAFYTTSIETTASLATLGGLSPGTPAGAFQTGKIHAGTGVPSNADGNNGDFYKRHDGTAAAKTLEYHKESGVWVPSIP
jgi:hypothetical protein